MDFSFHPPTRPDAQWRPGLVGGTFADRGLCGCSMNRGLLRFHDADSAPAAQVAVDAMCGARGLAAEVFAFDWLARQFAVTTRLTVEGASDSSQTLRTVVVLDPFDGSVTPWVDVESFEGALSVPIAHDFLLPDLFREWMEAAGIDQLAFDSCAEQLCRASTAASGRSETSPSTPSRCTCRSHNSSGNTGRRTGQARHRLTSLRPRDSQRETDRDRIAPPHRGRSHSGRFRSSCVVRRRPDSAHA